MNGSYYKTPVFLNDIERDSNMPNNYQTDYPMEQSYIENIIRNNIGKKVRVHASFSDSVEWRDRVFSGIIEQSGKDHIIISDPTTGKWYLLLLIYLDYVEFDEKINYIKSF